MAKQANLADREDVCEALRRASAERLKVAPVGRGTKLGMGGAGAPADVVLSLERLNRVSDYPASDLTITVEAGLPIRDLAPTLAAKGQMLPLDVPFATEATIGGTIAANVNGPRRLAYGSWRDLVLGMQFVTAEGKLVKGGGRVVKNVAGYDLPKLLVGSMGTLGVIVEITLKVFPIPPATTTLAMHFRSPSEAASAANHILHSPLLPQALDLVDAAAGVVAGEPVLGDAPFTLLAGVAGPEQVLARFERELPNLVRGNGLQHCVCLHGEQESSLWSAIQELTPAFLRARPTGCVVKASLPLSRMGDYLTQARRNGELQEISVALLARAGSGIVYAHLYPGAGAGNAVIGERMRQSAERLIREAESTGGRAVVEWCPPELTGKINLWGAAGDDLPWMRKLKAALDPQGILSPGRFYGGI
jgi:glycolate dehydrogenase FAD-binding subunit